MSYIYTSTAYNLKAIFRPDISVVIWHRENSQAFTDSFKNYCQFIADNFDIDNENAPIETIPAIQELINNKNKIQLFSEIDKLTNIFYNLFNKCSSKLFTTGLDECNKYHVDYNHYRMITTFAGPCTEVLEPHKVNRDFLGSEEPVLTANTLIKSDALKLEINVGDIVLMKGEGLPRNIGMGCVHRSPPLEQDGKRRLVLTLTKK